MERIRSYKAQLYAQTRSYWASKSTPWITQFCGESGMGKTTLAKSYLEAFGGQYFSFRNLDDFLFLRSLRRSLSTAYTQEEIFAGQTLHPDSGKKNIVDRMLPDNF